MRPSTTTATTTASTTGTSDAGRGRAPVDLRDRLDGLVLRVAAATPPDRDRVMDLLRVASMLVVAFGHWLMAIVWVTPEGRLDASSLLVDAPWTQVATLGLQVMGLFFAVGGWASARSLARRSTSTVPWVHGRVRRLLAPATLYVAVVAIVVPLVGGIVGPEAAATARRAFTVHLWFCAAIVPIHLLTPALFSAWRAWGPRLLVVLTAGAVVVDVAHRILALPLVGWLNFLFVWGAATVLGFAWAEGALGHATARRLTVGGAVVLAGLVATPWIPLSMVGVDGAGVSNNFPPSSALVALTAVHVGLVVIATPRLRRLTARPWLWAGVALAGRAAVTVYLWHLLALGLLVAAIVAVAPTTLSTPPLTVAWWASRPLWFAALVMATAPLVAGTMRVERRLRPVVAPGPGRVVVAGTLATIGCGALALQGLAATWAVAAVLVAALIGRWVPVTSSR